VGLPAHEVALLDPTAEALGLALEDAIRHAL
jgi:hypothetical protein